MRKATCALIVMLIAAAAHAMPSVVDKSLVVQTWVKGLVQPTGMAFVDDKGTALVLEKSTGRVRIMSGKALTGTALDLAVARDAERGLLGITLSPTFASDKFVYLYFTKSSVDGGAAIDNRVERYRWSGSKLNFDRKIISMPATPGPNHDGGKITFGPDGKLYIGIGDLNRNERTENFENSGIASASGAILRVNPDGSTITTNPFYNSRLVGTANAAQNQIYAYGVRNSFGMAFDPLSRSLWDTENGPDSYDEINRVNAGFNSGWEDIMGPTWRHGRTTGKLASLGAAAHYEEPKMSWKTPVAPTDAFFMDSSRLGTKYKWDLFVGALHDDGLIFKFDMSPSRKTLGLSGPLSDGVADNSSTSLLAEQASIVFGNGFGTVTDLLSGPGGVFVVSIDGMVYRITTKTATASSVTAVPEPAAGLLIMIPLLMRRRRARAA